MDATWAKSSFSFSNGNCVEVAQLPGRSVGVRDSRDPAGPVLRFTRDGWDTFLAGARRGKLEVFSAHVPESAARYRASLTAGLAPQAAQPSWPTLGNCQLTLKPPRPFRSTSLRVPGGCRHRRPSTSTLRLTVRRRLRG